MRVSNHLLALSLLFASSACTHARGSFPVSKESVRPGTSVTAGGKPTKLIGEGGHVWVGKPIATFWKELGSDQKLDGKVAVINVVPSIDTQVCEEQTHLLGDESLPTDILRITVSRDLPMAQQRFAKEAKLTNISYVSDYKSGAFGKSTGLLMEGSELLARAVIVVDKKGIVRHLQVVPNVATLPDMDKAFAVAKSLDAEK